MRSLYEELAAVKDFRRAQGRKHTVASVLAVYILARLANIRGPVAAAKYAQQLSQAELKSRRRLEVPPDRPLRAGFPSPPCTG